eukprot:CAMPEP_0118907344 /NCGR_PEP_ID=MMETSP1166-20130328/10835_1 /TAXON_ID=1104430 /ORGANISM="Chrysoreinhardia sp, Strain CCMP3193" /LENGTH=272 /DNA_ID=CAMNT_0006846709 /DNA_START=10 /DNA_END=825 /DNA_ORIENTATION=-
MSLFFLRVVVFFGLNFVVGVVRSLFDGGPPARVSVVSVKAPVDEGFSVWHRVWDWKRSVMGLDMMLPRPRACRALAEAVVSNGAEEALVLSTCARLDVVVALTQSRDDDDDDERAAVEVVAKTLAAQVEAWRSRRTSWRYELDLASELILSCGGSDSALKDAVAEIVVVRNETRLAATHLAEVSSGLADAEAFDPFSSKQAFVQRQLRAALSACDNGPTGETLRVVVRTALEIGRKARSDNSEANRQFRIRKDEASRLAAEHAARAATVEAA